MKIDEKWPEKTLELPIPKPQEPFPREFMRWLESRLITKKLPRQPQTRDRKASKKN